jgi:hypothetical protein
LDLALASFLREPSPILEEGPESRSNVIAKPVIARAALFRSRVWPFVELALKRVDRNGLLDVDR